MSLTLQQMEKEELIKELAKCFDREPAALALLGKMDIDTVFFPQFNSMPPFDCWNRV